MLQQVLLPKLGETMTEATIEKWHKTEGDSVKKGEVILEITTDKATLEVESGVSGILRKIIAPEKVVLLVNSVIALVGEASDELPENLQELIASASSSKGVVAAAAQAGGAKSAEKAEAEVTPAAEHPDRIFASPRARMRAEEEKVPLSVLRGTGAGGRIVEDDVLAYIQKRKAKRVTPVAMEIAYERGIDVAGINGTGISGEVTKTDVLAAKLAVVTRGARIELTPMRRIIAERMAKSKREAPHFYLMMEIDMTSAAAQRAKMNAGGATRIGFHDFVIRACGKALAENPNMNVVWAGDHVVRKSEIGIGLAVALEEGLIVPVIRNADTLDLVKTAQASAGLIEKARSKRLTPDEYEGGSMTISNLGMFEIDNFIPVINPGESAILGIGKIAQKPVVIDGHIQVRTMLSCTLSADHRAVDGAIAAKFLKKVKELLEHPEQL